MPAGYGAVFVDEPVAEPQDQVAGAALFSATGGEIATVDDPRFVVLRHPVEDDGLKRTGYRWNDLLWQGRYVEVTNVVCRECGSRSTAAPRTPPTRSRGSAWSRRPQPHRARQRRTAQRMSESS